MQKLCVLFLSFHSFSHQPNNRTYSKKVTQSCVQNLKKLIDKCARSRSQKPKKVQLSSKLGNEVKVKARPNFKLFSYSPGTKSSKTQSQSSTILVTKEIKKRETHMQARELRSAMGILYKKNAWKMKMTVEVSHRTLQNRI